jgi:hypothetical protein
MAVVSLVMKKNEINIPSKGLRFKKRINLKIILYWHAISLATYTK